MSEGDRNKVVAVLGNGVSVAVSPGLSLAALTSRFLEQHARDRDELDRLLSEVNLRDLDPGRDFEAIVGGLESAEEIIRGFLALAEASQHGSLRQAAQILREAGVPELVRGLYYAYCSEVLEAIGNVSRSGPSEAVVGFVRWLESMREARGACLGICTLNYDVLLERILVDDDLAGVRDRLTDGFSGRPQDAATLTLNPETDYQAVARPFLPATELPRDIRVRHLHGSLTCFSDIEGRVFKVAAQAVRDSGVYDCLRRGSLRQALVPAVVLGGKKSRKILQWPFAEAFSQLAGWLSRASVVVVAGYSFRDAHVNRSLAASRQPGTRWIVIDKPGTRLNASATGRRPLACSGGSRSLSGTSRGSRASFLARKLVDGRWRGAGSRAVGLTSKAAGPSL